MEERHEDKTRRQDRSPGQGSDPAESRTIRGDGHRRDDDAGDPGSAPGSERGAGAAPTAAWPDHIEDLLALMPAPLRHYIEKPAALMPHECEAFDRELLSLYAAILPRDAQEWWCLIKAAEHAVLALRYRQVETKLTAQRARSILRAHLGERHLKQPGKHLTREDVQAHNDALADRWAVGDGEARREVGRLIKGVADEAEIWSQATEIVLDQFGALRTLADRAEAGVRRVLRDIGWLRNLKRLCDKDGVPWNAMSAAPPSFAGV